VCAVAAAYTPCFSRMPDLQLAAMHRTSDACPVNRCLPRAACSLWHTDLATAAILLQEVPRVVREAERACSRELYEPHKLSAAARVEPNECRRGIFAVRHASLLRRRAGAAHCSANDAPAPAGGPASPHMGSPCRSCSHSPHSPRNPAQHKARMAQAPAACDHARGTVVLGHMQGCRDMRSVTRADRVRRQAVQAAARAKLDAVNTLQQQLAARRAALMSHTAQPFVGTYEDNISCARLATAFCTPSRVLFQHVLCEHLMH
jgi:hypothetical protein